MGYNLRDIFNADETGLFYSMPGNKTIACKCFAGKKKVKKRLSLLLTANADGSEKLQTLVIGTAKKPRPFHGKTPNECGYNYAHSAKGWMNTSIFQDWLTKFNDRMKQEERNALLLVDGVSCHRSAVNGIRYSNLRAEFFPANTTSILQPMDAGVIASFKAMYKRKHLARALELSDLGCTNIYDRDIREVMLWIDEVTAELSPKKVANCWRHVDFVYQYDDHCTKSRVLDDLPIDDNM
jgi:hypothetical protein